MKKSIDQNKTFLSSGEVKVIPIVREEVTLGKRKKETGLTRIKKIVHEAIQRIDEPVIKQTVEVKRVPVNKVVDKALPTRDENGTLIVPVYEEIAVVEKRLLLKEELHVRKLTVQSSQTEDILVRSEEAVVEHVDVSEHAEAGEQAEHEDRPARSLRRAV